METQIRFRRGDKQQIVPFAVHQLRQRRVDAAYSIRTIFHKAYFLIGEAGAYLRVSLPSSPCAVSFHQRLERPPRTFARDDAMSQRRQAEDDKEQVRGTCALSSRTAHERPA